MIENRRVPPIGPRVALAAPAARPPGPPPLQPHGGTREFRVHGLETKFYGRREALEVLYNAIRDAVNMRRLNVVTIVGRAGLGKTRLVHEFTNLIDIEARGISLLATLSTEDEPEHSLRGVEQLLRQRFAITSGHDDAETRELLRRGLSEIVDGRRLADAALLLGHLCGLAPPEGSRPDLQVASDAVLQRALSTLFNLVKFDASRRPLILVFDSLQWARQRTRELLGGLVKTLRDAAALVLVLSREPVDEGLTAGAQLHPLAIEPLAEPVMTKILRHLLRRVTDLPTSLVDRTVQRAKGSPALLEDIVRLMLQREILVDHGERWELHMDRLKGARLPNTTAGAAKARVDGLGERERAVLEMASVFGPVFWFGGVLSMLRTAREPDVDEAGTPRAWIDDKRESRLNATLLEMQSQDLIEFKPDSGLPGEVAFSFINPIEQQRVAAELPPERRSLLHRLAAQWLAQVAPKDSFQIQEVVAWHLETGGANEAAADAYRRAADLARATWQNRRAVDHLRRALSLYDLTQAEKKSAVCDALAELLGLLGEYGEARAASLELLYLSTVLTSRVWGGRAYLRLGQTARQTGDYKGAMELLERALKLFQDAADHGGIANALDDIGRVHWYRGEYGSYREALSHFLKSLSLRRRAKSEGAIALSLGNIGNIHLGRGQFKQAEESFKEALEIRRRLADRWGMALTLIGMGAVHHECGRVGDAVECWEEGLGIATEVGDRELQAILQNNLGEAKLALGIAADAEPLLASAHETAAEIGDRRTLADVLRNKATLARMRGHYERALELARDSARIGEAIEGKQLIGNALRTEADILAELLKRPLTPATSSALQPDSDKLASDCYQRSMAYFEEMGDVLGLARSMRSYGGFLLERGITNKARKLLARADEVLAEVGARG